MFEHPISLATFDALVYERVIDAGVMHHYNDPSRAYHSWTHIQALIREFRARIEDKSWQLNERDVTLILDTIAFHDVYYDAYAPHGFNEQMSGVIAEENLRARNFACSKLKHMHIGYVKSIIGLTKDHTLYQDIHGWSNHKVAPADDADHLQRAAEHMLDLDLSGFAGDDERMVFKNTMRVGAEYYLHDQREISKGQVSFLTKLLSRPRIYYTAYYQAREDQARANILYTIDMLSSVG